MSENTQGLSAEERAELEQLRAEKAAREQAARDRAERAELERLKAERDRKRAEAEKDAHARELRERGFDSPEPVAYVCYREGLTRQSTYYVCLHSHYRHSMEDIMDLPPEERDEVVKQLGVYCARLHADGFLHRDFSPDNVLFDKIDGRYRFSLIDTNSIKTGKPVSMEQGEQNLKQLDTSQGLFGLLLAVYRDEREKLKG